MVIIPRIEYQLQAIVLSKEECEFLMQRINCYQDWHQIS